MNFKNNKSRVLVGAAVSAVSLSLTGMGATQSRAQSTASQALPPVSVDAPQQRARVTNTARSRGTSQRSSRVAPRPPSSVLFGKRDRHDDGHDAYDRNSRASLCRWSGGAGRNARPARQPERDECAVQHDNYTSQLIENQQARTAADTLINNASVRASTGQNGFDDTLQIRGFPVGAGDIGLNGLYGLVSSNRVPS